MAPSLDELLARLASGDIEALDGIYNQIADDLYGLALWRCGSEAEAADAVQETFVRLAKMARATADLGKVRDARAYLLGAVRRAAVDQIRKRRGHASVDDLPEGGRLLEAVAVDPSAAVDVELACRRLAEVPPKQREVVYLRCFEELSFEQIARICRIPTFTAASRFRLGLQKLRSRLEKG